MILVVDWRGFLFGRCVGVCERVSDCDGEYFSGFDI